MYRSHLPHIRFTPGSTYRTLTCIDTHEKINNRREVVTWRKEGEVFFFSSNKSSVVISLDTIFIINLE